MGKQRNGRVTVVIPTYNRAQYVPAALRSVLDQTAAQRCDIVVVDDGSSDDTRSVLAQFSGRVRCQWQSHRGVAAARNAAIRAWPNEYVAFLDTDDEWAPDKIERQLAVMERWPEVVLVAGRTQVRRPDGSIAPHVVPPLPAGRPADLRPQLFASCPIETPAIMVRYGALRKTGLFWTSLKRGSDYHLWVRLACCGPCVYLDGSPLATFRVDAPWSLSSHAAASIGGVLKAVHWLAPLAKRNGCRAAWRQRVLACLRTLRDHARRGGCARDEARYGLEALLREPLGRPRWEWRMCAEACMRAFLRQPPPAGHAVTQAEQRPTTSPPDGRVAVIIPTYNRAHLIGRAIGSVLSQTAADRCEIVVVDDGGADNTADVVSGFDGRVCYLRQANAGPAAARNAGIRASSSEFIAFLDADDEWLPDKIERQLGAMCGPREVLIVAGRALDRDADGALRGRPDPPVATDSPVDFAPRLFIDNFLATSTVMVRRCGLARTGLFRPDLPQSEDYELWGRLACRGTGVFLDDPLALYAAAEPGSLTRDRTALLRSNLRARTLLRRELLRRPDCRANWWAGLADCLARLRDECYRRGDFADAAWFGAGSLLCRPWPRPKWELGRLFAAAARAAAGSITAAAHSSQVQCSATKSRPRRPIAAAV
jgi:glycosyltransferase involved in cell wall biosynthesis